MTGVSSEGHVPQASKLIALFALANRSTEKVLLPLNNMACEGHAATRAFYCIHSVSGAAGLEYTRLAALMPRTRFFGLQAPTKKMADKSFGESLLDIGDYYAHVLDRFQPDGPFYVGGWSVGATVALETAVRLRKRGRTVRLVAAIEGAPENTGADLPAWDPRSIVQAAVNLPRWLLHDPIEGKASASAGFKRLFTRPTLSARSSAALPYPPTTLDLAVRTRVSDLDRYPLVQQLFMQRLYDAAFAYWPKPYPDPIVLYEATVQPMRNRPQFARAWRALSPQTSVVKVSGTHVSVMRTKHLETIANDLQRRIESQFP
jgi:thioesterase domain-containing protein